ncbi:MAG: TonB-dependent receptor plug domain-containing protein [Flavobacteriaceae bacterium]|nr:TonB-dependent receptor plug domain-containing protein [Flavobacteriaceae bacterium]
MSTKKILLVVLLFTCFTVLAKERLTICWDVSLSMQNRDLEQELGFLNNYFSKYQDITVTVLEFNNIRVVESEFEIKNGKWEDLKNQLTHASYDGATGYQLLNANIRRGTVFVFTDGKETLVRDTTPIRGNPYIVNSKTDSDLENLKFMALYNKGRFIDLIQVPMDRNKTHSNAYYSGNIFSPIIALNDLLITTEETENRMIPKADGTYRIAAHSGDVLMVSAFGKILKRIELNDNKVVNLWIDGGVEKLEEVLIKKKRDIAESEEEVQTGLEKRTRRKLGYAAGTLEEEEIKTYATLADALRGKLAGVFVGDDLGFVQIGGRITSNRGSRNALVVLDGAPLAKDTRVEGLATPQTVASITVLKGMAATTLYGTEGRNGVIIITTKAALRNETKIEARNLYKGEKLERQKPPKPSYILELETLSGSKEKYDKYLNQREAYWEHPLYLTDVYEYMSNVDISLALQIAYSALDREDSSLDILRALLITSYKLGHYQLSLDVAYTTLINYPQQTQSYLDLALAYKTLGNYPEALNRFLAVENGTANPALDFTHIAPIAQNEIRDLVANHGDKMDLSNVPMELREQKKLKSRIVVDWSNRDAEFVLTFINPDGLYYRWVHTLTNEELIENEVLHGFSQKEFEIDGGNLGEWVVNINYLGNKILDKEVPSLIKCRVTHDYGTPEERTEQRVVRLYKEGSNEQLTTFVTH